MNRLRTSLVVVLLLVATAATGCAPGALSVTITIHHSAFEPTTITVPRGVPVTFVLINQDPIDHEWLIGDEAFHERHRSGTHASHGAVPNEVTVPALRTATTTITFHEAGNLAYICHLPGHEAYGMVGLVSVDG
jgi:uncharacterized cupredoxin-like copper-binding protein